MIKEIREQQPFIHFGFNRQEINIYLNETITIWQDKIYKVDSYTNPLLRAPSSILVNSNMNAYELYFTSLGQKNCKLSFDGVGKKVLKSNEVKVNVLERLFEAKDIFFNNITVTFND